MTDAAGSQVLNRLALVWDVVPVIEPRPGSVNRSREFRVSCLPVTQQGTPNLKSWQNKAVTLATVTGPREAR
ncbi:MAG: hypothetical protein FJW35_18485 [Acidobacteria bacterium]|nr:hypothetical protein [Acidobacteriota bacterium]